MGLPRRYEDVLERHMAIMRLHEQGLPATTISRRLGLGHWVVLYHINGHCKCVPCQNGHHGELPVLVALRRELRAMEERLLACEAEGVKSDYLLVQALRRALILAGETPRVG
jgi:hypothetical protein